MTKPAVIFRSLALFAILYQFRLIADDLADTPVFVAALLAAFIIAAFLSKIVNPLAAVISIALIPWMVRFFYAIPRLFISGTHYDLAVSLDSLLLNFDRNNFVSLLPFYWAAATTWFSLRSRLVLRAAVIADAVILIGIFSFTSVSDFSIYRWPIVMIALLAGIIFTQALALLFSLPPEIKLQKSEKFAAIGALLVLIVFGALFFLKPSQERAVQKGGGLLEPKLFSFDFSQFLRLDTEISMSDDLIMIVKKDPDDDHVLTRRAVMSGYNKKQGFFRIEEIDEKTHPHRLPARPTLLFPAEFKSAQRVSQEYFLVNFDANAFIGMKEPVEIIPYETWDASSFKSAFAVESLTSTAIIDIEDDILWPEPQNFGLSEKEFVAYTAYGEDKRLQLLAEEITWNYPGYTEKVYAIFEWLRYGDFRYSLKPGIAPDGDQLAWFLFQTKKGYCTYYAFAMTLLLRSLGIPARVAAGFFVDPETGIFDYYPVRSDMAHAWVEVYFPDYGWIEFDPTTENLAEDEEFTFSAGVDPRLLERLMREILENRQHLKPKMGQDGKSTLGDTNYLMQLTVVVLKKLLLPVLIISLLTLFVIIRCGYLFLYLMCRDRRKKAVNLWKHTRRRLRLAGYGQASSLAESEWALRSDTLVKGIYAMYLGAAAARFAPEYQNEDFVSLQNAYRLFSESYRKTVSPWRRFLAWAFPPLALVRRKAGLIMLLLLAFFAGDGRAQDDESNFDFYAGDLLTMAFDAELSEYWERAIELYKEGGALYPNDSRFPQALGRLYYSRALYNLAWDEYRKAEMIAPYDASVMFMLAHTAGYLNHNKTSVAYFEKVLALDPENRGAIGSLGWMYYKVHRLGDGERLLASAIERFGESADFAMTLATIYSDMYRYDDGKYWYAKSIALAEHMRSFIAVAYYNLSILETRFYRYGLSMDASNASLEAQNRASGLLARGELNMRRLELEKAQSDFQEAREIDPSPLAKMNLAQTFQISGRLEEARLYALDCLKASDNSWMMHYGIDPVRYKKDLHDILHKTYAGFTQAERFVPCRTPIEKIRSILRTAYYRFYAEVHHKLYQKYSLAAGDDYKANDAPLFDQFTLYYDAFETYPRRALFYLNKARDFETAIIPASEATYNLETGVLLKDLNLTAKALDRFDSDWEGDLISQCYHEFALRGKTRAIRQSAAAELFALNRGALLQAGINLPVEINVRDAGGKEKVLRRALAKAGFTQTEKARFRLQLDFVIKGTPSEGATIFCEMIDSEGVVKPLRHAMTLNSLSGADFYGFAGELSSSIFRVD
jgi:transglutaminase-like putative cysteine protease/tetratricopeptide (TPR) repeat protein